MILLFTDFGYRGPYVGQMKACLAQRAPGHSVVDLMHDAPRFDPRASGHLLAAALGATPRRSVVCAVVDPGVGGARRALAVRCGDRWLVGPDNGLLVPAVRACGVDPELHRIDYDPATVSSSFHGRDVFAPAAAAIAAGRPAPLRSTSKGLVGDDWPPVLAEVIYVDEFGNAMTGIPGGQLTPEATIRVAGSALRHARTFSSVDHGQAFWTENSLGLVEIAVNQGSAADRFALAIGARVEVA